MLEKKKQYTYKRTPSFYRPPIPKDEWCDFRLEYESGSTLKEIAEKHFCDPRTVRRCISSNKSSTELGRQTEPTKLAPYYDMIDTLFQQIIIDKEADPGSDNKVGICEISRIITQQLISQGYTGSERTVRNYLRKKCQYIVHTDRKNLSRKENPYASD